MSTGTTTITYEYLPKQAEFMQACEEVKYPAYIGGFGSGKTHVLGLQAMRFASKRSRGLIGAQTYRMLEDTTQRKFFELCPPSWIKRFVKQDNIAVLSNGSEILFRSMQEPGKLSSLELDWFILDEVGEIKQSVFNMLQGRLRHRGGVLKGAVVGNPAGPAHWTYEYFVKKAQKYPKQYRLIQATSYENTFLPAEYTESMEISFDKDSAYYKRFVLGQFCAFEGAYWANFDPSPYPKGHVVSDAQIREFLDKPEEVAWHWGRVIDFGFEHPFTCLWYITNGKRIIFVDEYQRSHGLIQEHVQAMRAREAEHQVLFRPHVYVSTYTDHDAQARAEIAHCKDEMGNLIGFDCQPAEKKVMEGILLVQTLFQRRKLLISTRCERTQLEIPSYRAKEDSIKEQPIKENDDTCDCIRMACAEEMNHLVPFHRYDTGSEIPEDLWDLEPGMVATWET